MKRKHQTDTSPGWIRRRFEALEKQIREASAARRLESATIGKGGITVKNGGYISSNYSNGAVGAFIGPVNQSVDDPLGDGFALNVFDENGLVIFQLGRLVPSTDFPSGRSDIFVSADAVDINSEHGGSSLHMDDTQAYLFSNGVTHLYGNAGVTIQHSTTGAAANCFVDPSDGRIWRSTSSLRYKQDVENAEVDHAAVLDMQPRTWRDKAEVEADPKTERRYVGFIAEELHDLGLGQFVVYDTDGDPEAIAYDRLSVALLEVAKDQEKRLQLVEEALERHNA